ncbi:outer membrane protein assembly factor BamE [Thiotrichales bacterium 19S3-7]|nr:outer membrane protein assembly factor BamE [Thiotrichales bacterium 19S3-7]MCF6801120.1 outer membrane protein assembly factor BamE [Thiotrichales bacterium 19S3-11]
MINQKALAPLLVAFTLSLSACSLFTPYTAPVQQGKIITQKDIQQLKPGMTQSQVQFILGSPDIVDPFHKNTWYYVYTIKHYNTTMEEKQLQVEFSDGKLISIAGDYPPPQVIEYTKEDNANKSNTEPLNSQANEQTKSKTLQANP